MSAISGFIYTVLTHPDALELLKNELRTTFSAYDEITASRVEKLGYLDACLNEMLRMFPPGPAGFPRIAVQDSVIDGVFVPKGVSLLPPC